MPLEIRADKHAPWHPGRCAAIYAQVGSDEAREWLAGYAGELHPRVIEAFGLPARTCALELDLSVLFAAAETVGPASAPELSAYPLAIQDVALIVDAAVPAAEVEAALAAGVLADLLEGIRLFDVYTGAQIGADRKSLAYTLRFRPRTGRSPQWRPPTRVTRPSPRHSGVSALSCAAADDWPGADRSS